MNKKVLVIVIVAVIVVGGGVLALALQQPSSAPASQPSSSSNTTDGGGSNTVASATITYTDNGFSPSTLTVKPGSTIRVVNQSSGPLQLSSDPHPTHTDNPELNMDEIAPGKDGMLTVNKVGNWGYHNHEKESDKGHITITE